MILTRDYRVITARRKKRVAVEVLDYVKNRGKFKSYYGYGHGEDERVLWYYKDGHLKVVKHGPDDDRIHADYLSEPSFYYHGRYEPGSHLITLYKSTRQEHRPVPDVILSKLRQSFPDAKKLIVY